MAVILSFRLKHLIFFAEYRIMDRQIKATMIRKYTRRKASRETSLPKSPVNPARRTLRCSFKNDENIDDE